MQYILSVLTNQKATQDDSTIASEKQYIVQQVTVALVTIERRIRILMIHMLGTQVYIPL